MKIMTRVFLKHLVIVLTIYVCVLGDEIDNANQYMDELLDNLRKDPVISAKVEPIHVPDIKSRNFKATDICLKGLSSLQRDDRCKIVPKEGRIVTILVHLRATDIRFKLNYKAGVAPAFIRGKAEGKLDKVKIRCAVSLSPFDGTGKVDEFKVTHFGKFRVKKARGATFLFNWLVKIIANEMLRSSKDTIIKGIENSVSKLLEEKLSEVKISARRFQT